MPTPHILCPYGKTGTLIYTILTTISMIFYALLITSFLTFVAAFSYVLEFACCLRTFRKRDGGFVSEIVGGDGGLGGYVQGCTVKKSW
jgi:hypothetical protein